MRWCFAAILALTSTFAWTQCANPGAWVPGQDPATCGSLPMPLYFSGTDCRASGSARCEPGRSLVQAWLSLNGQNLKTWQHVPGEPEVTTAVLGLAFDSTHFVQNSSVEVRFKAKDDLGQFYEATGSAIVKNRACMYTYPQFSYVPGGYSAAEAFNQFVNKNYDRVFPPSESWPSAVLTDDLYSAGCWLVDSHASPTGHFCGPGIDDRYKSAPGNGSPNYLSTRFDWNFSGLPPFNPGGSPPVHLAIIEGCNTYGGFIGILYPFYSHYDPGQPYRNQALVTFNGTIFVGEGERTVKWLLEPLLAGNTIEFVIASYVLKAETTQPHTDSVHINVMDDEHRMDNKPGLEIALTGDGWMRLKSVYRNPLIIRKPPNDWWL